MNNFFRALRIGTRYRSTLLALILSSLAVAVLWGGNLGTVYPIVGVVLKQRSLRDWVDESLDNTLARRNTSQQTIDEILATLPGVDGVDAAARESRLDRDVRRKLSQARDQVLLEDKAAKWTRWVQPFVHRYLPTEPFPTLLLVVGILLLGTALKSVFVVVNIVLADRLVQLVAFDLRKRLYRETLQKDMGHFGEQRTAKLISHFTHDMEGVTAGVRNVFGRAILEPLKIIACFTGAAIVCWRLLLWSLIVTPVVCYLINRLAKSIKRANRRAMDEMAGVYQHLAESFNGIAAVKAFTMERYERQKMHRRSKDYLNKSLKISIYNSLTKPCNELMSIGVVCVAILFGGYLVLTQSTHVFGFRMSAHPLSFERLMAFFTLLAGVSDPFRKLTEVFNQIQRGAAAADRVYSLIDETTDLEQSRDPVRDLPPLRTLSIAGVEFAYEPGCPVLNGVDLDIAAGERIAIVGPNGCGKSTLIKMFPRFYDPAAGSVAWNDIPLSEVHLRTLRERIGIVSQQTLLFDDTVLNNIRYGSPLASEADVIAAAKKAHAHEFIDSKLSDGYDTIVGQGGTALSGGQRQRIALARAILRNPEVLILDEATSQIDVQSEQLIHQALESFTKGRTTIMITHRQSTLALADKIVVMEAGKVVDFGSHSVLLQRCPLYQRLSHRELQAA